jgi:hypothetical protein
MKRFLGVFSTTRACVAVLVVAGVAFFFPQVTQAQSAADQAQRTPTDTGDMIFFRGGFVNLRDDRGRQVFTDLFGIGGVENRGDDGWYVGAGIEHVLTKDLWGMFSGIWALGEINLEYKRFQSTEAPIVVPTAVCLLVGAPAECPPGGIVTRNVTLTMFTVSAAPKIKLLEGSPIRPWIIPAGLDFHVISPPSDAGTVLDVGVQFAAGVDFELWRGILVGVDGRYHLTANQTDSFLTGTFENDFWTVGGYLGFSF